MPPAHEPLMPSTARPLEGLQNETLCLDAPEELSVPPYQAQRLVHQSTIESERRTSTKHGQGSSNASTVKRPSSPWATFITTLATLTPVRAVATNLLMSAHATHGSQESRQVPPSHQRLTQWVTSLVAASLTTPSGTGTERYSSTNKRLGLKKLSLAETPASPPAIAPRRSPPSPAISAVARRAFRLAPP
jgi:hypothetical protein